MNSSGIVRRIDELGRIVIPVEVRRLLNIKVGENLEFEIKNDEIIIKKKSYVNNSLNIICPLIETLGSIISGNYFFTDRETILLSSNVNLVNKKLTDSISKYINSFEEYISIRGIEEYGIDSSIYLFPYSIENSLSGFICLYDVDNIDKYKNLINFICKYIHNRFSLSWKCFFTMLKSS